MDNYNLHFKQVMYKVTAIVADASYLCLPCAVERYPNAREAYGYLEGTDTEGNEIGALYRWEEWSNTIGTECDILMCDNCPTVLDTYHLEDCNIHNMYCVSRLTEGN